MSTGDIVLPWINALVLALLALLGRMALAELQKRNLDNKFFQAVARAGGVAYTNLLASGRPVTDKVALLEAAMAGAAYLKERVPSLVAARGLSPVAREQIVGAELGKLLAADPSLGPLK